MQEQGVGRRFAVVGRNRAVASARRRHGFGIGSRRDHRPLLAPGSAIYTAAMTAIALAAALPLPQMAGEPQHDCGLCPRLVETRAANRAAHPDWFNAPVPGWGDRDGWLAVVGLAPGRAGANRTGRPFTGDGAGRLLHATLARFGLSLGDAGDSADDGLVLDGVFITNAVRCVPPGNKPTSAEIHACRQFLAAQLDALPHLKVVIALGATAHQSAVKACGGKLPKAPFGHGHVHRLHGQQFGAVTLIDSYHPSQLNTATGRLTPDMFEAVFAAALAAR